VAMSTPSWLYYLFGVLMLGVAAYCCALLVLGALTNRPAGRDVEISHAFMGVAMAGMFVGQWSFGRSATWEIIFALFMIWFLTAAIQSVLQYGLHLAHALIHAVMSFAMLLMYWFPMGAGGAARSMAMGESSAGGHLDPGLAALVALILCASAIFTLASPIKGRSHFGSHAPAYVFSGAAGNAPDSGHTDDSSPSVRALESKVASPWLVDVSHVIMCVSMAFMLVLMT
jgi:hypothetical protein